MLTKKEKEALEYLKTHSTRGYKVTEYVEDNRSYGRTNHKKIERMYLKYQKDMIEETKRKKYAPLTFEDFDAVDNWQMIQEVKLDKLIEESKPVRMHKKLFFIDDMD
jgi:hypothetical protein